MKLFKLIGIVWIYFTLIHLYLGNDIMPMLIVGTACFVLIAYNTKYDTFQALLYLTWVITSNQDYVPLKHLIALRLTVIDYAKILKAQVLGMT